MNPRLRAWARREYYDPEPVLRGLRRIELDLAAADVPELVRRLRTNGLKAEREARLAFIFSYGMQVVGGVPILVSPGEDEDCDFITRRVVGDKDAFTCVQLKELAPADLSPMHTLDALIRGVQKRPSSDAVLVVHLNRRGQIPLSELTAVRVPFAGLYFLWAADPTSTTWRILGDVLDSPAVHTFAYPA